MRSPIISHQALNAQDTQGQVRRDPLHQCGDTSSVHSHSMKGGEHCRGETMVQSSAQITPIQNEEVGGWGGVA